MILARVALIGILGSIASSTTSKPGVSLILHPVEELPILTNQLSNFVESSLSHKSIPSAVHFVSSTVSNAALPRLMETANFTFVLIELNSRGAARFKETVYANIEPHAHYLLAINKCGEKFELFASWTKIEAAISLIKCPFKNVLPRRKLVVGVRCMAPFVYFQGKQSETLAGIEWEILEVIKSRNGFETELIYCTNKSDCMKRLIELCEMKMY